MADAATGGRASVCGEVIGAATDDVIDAVTDAVTDDATSGADVARSFHSGPNPISCNICSRLKPIDDFPIS